MSQARAHQPTADTHHSATTSHNPRRVRVCTNPAVDLSKFLPETCRRYMLNPFLLYRKFSQHWLGSRVTHLPVVGAQLRGVLEQEPDAVG